MTDIEAYITKHNGIIVYEDKEIQGLKLELKVIESKLQKLSETKNEYINDIEEFNAQYRLKLGEIISKILKLEREILFEQIIQKGKAFRERKDRYEQSKEEYKKLKVEKEDLEKNLDKIDEFDDEYDEIYEKLQKLKKELHKQEDELNKRRKEAKRAKEELEGDPTQQEYRKAKSNYKGFSDEYDEVLKEERYEITDEEKKELKRLFRKAARLCHPDIVTDELKEQAQAIIQELNNAYAKKDLSKVREILRSLENGISFNVSSDTINDIEILKAKIVDIRNKIDHTQQELEAIKKDEVFTIIQEMDDLDMYFEDMKEKLQGKYEALLNADFDK